MKYKDKEGSSNIEDRRREPYTKKMSEQTKGKLVAALGGPMLDHVNPTRVKARSKKTTNNSPAVPSIDGKVVAATDKPGMGYNKGKNKSTKKSGGLRKTANIRKVMR